MAGTCTFSGCARPMYAKQYCCGHYKQHLQGRTLAPLRKHGGSSPRDVEPRLIRRRRIDVDTGCWVWTGSKTGNGYGQIQTGGRVLVVHRVAYEHWVGPVEDETLHHTCANRLCFNPEHLQPVSVRENIAEMRLRQHYLARIERQQKRIAELEERLAALAGNEAIPGAP